MAIRIATVQVKITEQERQLIEEVASKEGATVSSYVRSCVLLAMVMEGHPAAIQLVAQEVDSKAFEQLRRQMIRS